MQQAAAALAIEPPEFAAEQLIQADGSDLQVDAYSVPEVADWDADGLADLIVGEKFSTSLGKVRIYLNTGTAAAPVYATSFYAQAEGAELTVPASGCLGVFPQVTDFDYDGRKDLLLGLADGRVQVRINTNTDADPLFGPESYVQVGLPGSKGNVNFGARATLEVVDFNNDGRLDLVLGAMDGKVRVLLDEATSGGPDFQSVIVLQDGGVDLAVPTGRSSPAVYDLDGDGRKDLVAGNTAGQVLFWSNTGTDAAPVFDGYVALEEMGTGSFFAETASQHQDALPKKVPVPFSDVADSVPIDLAGTPRSRPWVGDANADGAADLLVGAYDGLVRLYAGEPLTPAPFDILTPTGTIDDPTPEITWEAAAGATSYDVLISTGPDLIVPVVEFFDVTETSVTLTEPLDDGTYYIGVTAVGPNQTPQVDAGPDVTIGPGQWLVGSGLFTDPDHRVEATNNRLSFEVASAPEPYHRVFVTSLRFSIDPSQSFPPSAGVSFGGMQAADWQVTLSAFYGGLLSNWDGYAIVYQAILSTSTVAARDRNAVHGPVYNLAGELVAASASQLWSDDLQNPVGYDEWGAGPVPTLTEPWTGTFADGTHSGNSCSAWSTQFDTGTVGDASRTASNWLNADIQGCDRKARLYAISPLLGVAPTVDAGGDAAGVQGEAFTRSGSFADRGDVFWTATVDYGDGAAPQSLPLDFEAHAFQLDHTYTTPGTYPVTVTINDSDPSTDAAVTTFEVDVQQAGPGPFTITGPVGQIVIEYATVTWEASAGATSYELVVSQSSDLSSPVQEYFDLTGTSQVLDALNNGTYYVGVTAANDDALTTDATNNGFSFTVAVSFPAPFSITGPVSPVQTETPTVSWEASANATGYDMIVATDMACTAPIATYEDLVVTSQLLDPMVNGTYYVCVTAFDNYNHEVAATNSGFAFNVLVQPPGAFLITAPSAPVNAQSATIAWEVAERAIEYDLAVSTASDCSAALENYNGLTVTTQTTGTLANGTYYACVTARDADGRTSVATNNGFSFEIAYVPPKEHRIFVTSVETTIDQNESFPPPYPGWGGLAAADWTCTYHAYLGGYLPNWDGLQVVYHAVLSTTAETAHDSLQIEGPILNTAGQTVADSAAEFWSGTLQNGITYDETGAAAPANSLVWTGTLNDGSYGGNSCGAWNDVNFNGLVGLSDETSLGWTSSHTQPCTASARLYCLSPKESKGSGAFVPAVTGGRKSEATTTPDRFDLTASALQLVDAAGEPVRIEFNEDTVLIGTATWCSASTMLKQMLAEPDTAAQLAGLRIVFALGDEGGEGPGGTVNAEYLEDLPGEVVFLTDRSQTRPTAFPTVYDPAQNRFTNQTAFEWIDQWLARRTVTINDSDPGTAAVTTFEVAAAGVGWVEVRDPRGEEIGGDLTRGSRASTHPTAMADAVLWTATVDYDDGAGPVPLVLNPDKTFALNHQYNDPGTYTVTVTVTDDEGAEGIDTLQVTVLGPPEVVGRYVFYGGSTHGTTIAPDKTPLLPESIATTANYTSYSRGINGLIVDLANLPADVTPTAADFEFHIGNDNDPAGWTELDVEPIVTMQRGGGTDGSDRVTIVLPDGVVRNIWLEVTVLPTADVFYIGNAVAEAGDSSLDATVTTTDLLLARNNPRSLATNPADVTFPYDFDRDGQVNATDVLLARNNQTSFFNALELIDLSGEGEEVSARALAWLAEFGLDRTGAADRTPETQDAIDLLLATYWL